MASSFKKKDCSETTTRPASEAVDAKVFEKKFARTGAGVFDVVDAVVPDGVQDERERLIHLGPIIGL